MIVDASVALKWFLDEPQRDEARALIAREDLKAPDIIVPEVLNGLRKGVRDNRIALNLAQEAVRKLELAVPTIAPSILFSDRALELSTDLGHHIYDCLYLSQAIEMDSRVVTADVVFHDLIASTRWATNIVLLGRVN